MKTSSNNFGKCVSLNSGRRSNNGFPSTSLPFPQKSLMLLFAMVITMSLPLKFANPNGDFINNMLKRFSLSFISFKAFSSCFNWFIRVSFSVTSSATCIIFLISLKSSNTGEWHIFQYFLIKPPSKFGISYFKIGKVSGILFFKTLFNDTLIMFPPSELCSSGLSGNTSNKY